MANIIYGIDVQEKEDPYLTTVQKIAEAGLDILRHGTYLVDFIPIRKEKEALEKSCPDLARF